MNYGANSFAYDAYGRRTAKTISGTTTNYLYDGGNVVQELSGTTPTANLLSGGIDEVFTWTDSSGTANFLTDALGSPLNLTGSSGNSLAQYAYEPFGNTFVTSGSSTNPFQYTGRENDGTGLYFYRARYYSPSLQPFASEDPLAMFGSGPNLYAYTYNNPTNLSDPSGAVAPRIYAPPSAVTAGRKDLKTFELKTTGEQLRWCQRRAELNYERCLKGQEPLNPPDNCSATLERKFGIKPRMLGELANA